MDMQRKDEVISWRTTSNFAAWLKETLMHDIIIIMAF